MAGIPYLSRVSYGVFFSVSLISGVQLGEQAVDCLDSDVVGGVGGEVAAEIEFFGRSAEFGEARKQPGGGLRVVFSCGGQADAQLVGLRFEVLRIGAFEELHAHPLQPAG